MYANDLSTTKSRLNSWWPVRGRRRVGSPLRDERGSGTLEFAFVAVFLFMLIGGIVDLGGAFHNYIVLLNASREGARLYSRLPCKSDNRTALEWAVKDAAMNETDGTAGISLASGDITLVPNPGSGCPAKGGNVRVEVQDNYPALFGRLLGFDSVPISASTDMMFYGTDGSSDSQ